MAITISADDGDEERSELLKLPISEFEQILKDPSDPRHADARAQNREMVDLMRRALKPYTEPWVENTKKALDELIKSQLGHIDFTRGLRTIDVSGLFPDAGVDAVVTDVRFEDDEQELAVVSAVPSQKSTGEVFERMAERLDRVVEHTQARLDQAARHADAQHTNAEASGAVAAEALDVGKSTLKVGKVAMTVGIAAAAFGLVAAIAAVWTLIVTLAA